MTDKITHFKHIIKTPLSTISVAVDSITPLIDDLMLKKETLDFEAHIKNIATEKQLEIILKLLHNIELAVEQITRSLLILEEK